MSCPGHVFFFLFGRGTFLLHCRRILTTTDSILTLTQRKLVQLAGAVEYTDCFSAGGKTPPPNDCPACDTKHSDGEVPVMLEIWGMQSTPSLPSLPGPLWPRMVAPDRVQSMGHIELDSVGGDGTVLTFKLRTYAKLNGSNELFEIQLFLTLKLYLR